MAKLPWSGHLLSIQPRIRLTRSFDERYHSYLGYSLLIEGVVENKDAKFTIGIGKGAQQKNQFQVGDKISGESLPVGDQQKEPVEYYKTSKLRFIARSTSDALTPPPWHGVPDELQIYRSRGHRNLSVRTYQSKCWSCIWGSRMPVIMIIDQWNPEDKAFRFETFCYGPKSCPFYKAGPTRKVPGRKGMIYEEPDWLDEESTAHRD